MFHLLIEKFLPEQQESKNLALFLTLMEKKEKESFLQDFKISNKNC